MEPVRRSIKADAENQNRNTSGKENKKLNPFEK